MRDFDIAVEHWPIAGEFTISRGSRTQATVVVARITSDGASGMGECVPYARYGESVESVVAQMQSIANDIRNGANIEDVQRLLPPGAARNASIAPSGI
jgi:L-alanine-DL-glutamate epimerase-like enolase superfamily enzyme